MHCHPKCIKTANYYFTVTHATLDLADEYESFCFTFDYCVPNKKGVEQLIKVCRTSP